MPDAAYRELAPDLRGRLTVGRPIQQGSGRRLIRRQPVGAASARECRSITDVISSRNRRTTSSSSSE